MIERHIRYYIILKQLVDKPLVEINSFLIYLSLSFRKNTRPGHREAIAFQPQLLHQFDVFLIKAVMIAGDFRRIAVGYLAGYAGKNVPD